MARGRNPVTIPAYFRRRFFDQHISDSNWAGGICRDTPDPPAGFLYDSVDFLVEQPGLLYKRGGWERHSAAAGTSPLHWVGTLDTPVRVVTIANNNHLYDVTSENVAGATDIGNVGFYPSENMNSNMPSVGSGVVSSQRLILTDGQTVHAPKYVHYEPSPDALVIHDLEGSPPVATYSCSHTSGLVLAAGTNDYLTDYSNRLWFEPQGGDIDRRALAHLTPNFLWEPDASNIDNPYPITGLASVGGSLLVFSLRNVMRIDGSTPPSTTNVRGDMVVRPFLNVGSADARSIVPFEEGVIFAGEEGVWWTNGSSVRSLTENEKGTGIQSYWRSLFPRFEYANHTSRQLIGGMINRDYYIICVQDNATPANNIVTLMCHVPSGSWTRVSNFAVNSMAQGTDEEAVSELYIAEATTNFVSRASRMVYPSSVNMSDGNGVAIEPTFTTRTLTGDIGMHAYGYGWLSYYLRLSQGALASWSALHTYALNALIYVTYTRQGFGEATPAVFKATVGGVSAAVAPAWVNAPRAGDTITDGTVTWTNQGPTLRVKALKGLGMWASTDDQELAATGIASSDFVNRKRFKVFTDTQALAIKVTQHGYSSETGIQLLEIEEHIYSPVADSLGR